MLHRAFINEWPNKTPSHTLKDGIRRYVIYNPVQVYKAVQRCMFCTLLSPTQLHDHLKSVLGAIATHVAGIANVACSISTKWHSGNGFHQTIVTDLGFQWANGGF